MDWIPGDWRESPVFLEHIKDPDYRQWASDLNAFWKQLGRQMTEDVAVSTSQLLICLFFSSKLYAGIQQNSCFDYLFGIIIEKSRSLFDHSREKSGNCARWPFP